MLIGADESNFVITEIAAEPDGLSAYPVGFHFGLIQESAEQVHAKHAELTAAGFHPEPIGASFDVLGATWTAFYCHLGDGLQIKVNHRTRSNLLDGNDVGRRSQSETEPATLNVASRDSP